MIERESGFYWVDLTEEGWFVAEFSADLGSWYFPGEQKPYYDKDFTDIDERRIVRGDRNA